MITTPPALSIRSLDATSPAEIETFWRVRNAAHHADRPHAVLEGLGALRELIDRPTPYHERIWLIALLDGEIVGIVELELPLADNVHSAAIDVAVAVDARRSGVASALHAAAVARAHAAGRSVLVGEVSAPNLAGSAAMAFAAAMGYQRVHLEHHLVLDLPAPSDALAALGEVDAEYEIISWADACPPEWRPAYLAMRNQMNADVPRGDADVEPVLLTDQRLASSEQLLAASYRILVAAARHRATGAFAGYSVVFLPHEDVELAWQDATLVMPEHRGHRIGLALKRANLERIAAQHPSRRVAHTWTDPDNTAMYRTNKRVGFQRAEVTCEMEQKIS
ncbi:GNAT family N-acetyltransferase [Microbacterium sp. H1-D42]|uniref:GNAT family N-acetyltransferase n=1 Tax=Microbacterium sp. H1-D42 TaxID=2925844 RepID=UPI001F52C05B|nr:GNAT family N-acetyltransferase [Microbacterium sp. H1-D42]UNK69840.1 GNAT family N-acetyltransferase [Microbacterium sp. H1-D42]